MVVGWLVEVGGLQGTQCPGYMVIPDTWSILAGPDADDLTGTHCSLAASEDHDQGKEVVGKPIQFRFGFGQNMFRFRCFGFLPFRLSAKTLFFGQNSLFHPK